MIPPLKTHKTAQRMAHNHTEQQEPNQETNSISTSPWTLCLTLASHRFFGLFFHVQDMKGFYADGWNNNNKITE